MPRTFNALIALLIITSHVTGAILKYRSGYTTTVAITDTAAVYDTLKCMITVVDKKENGIREIPKRKLDCLIMGNDTLSGERLQCMSFSAEKAAALLARNNDYCRLSYAAGEAAGKQHDVGKLPVVGTVTGCLTGPVGVGIMYCLGRTSRPIPQEIPDTVQTDCFLYGYQKTAKKKNTSAAWGHGVFGFALTVCVFLIITGQTEYESDYHGQGFGMP